MFSWFSNGKKVKVDTSKCEELLAILTVLAVYDKKLSVLLLLLEIRCEYFALLLQVSMGMDKLLSVFETLE